jgi:hypothetical protein
MDVRALARRLYHLPPAALVAWSRNRLDWLAPSRPSASAVTIEYLRSLEYSELMSRGLPIPAVYDRHEAQNETRRFNVRHRDAPTGIYSMGYPIASITIVAAVVNIGANLVLIPRIGFMGAAWATATSNIALALLACAFSRYALPLPQRWGRWMVVLAPCSVGLVGLWWLDDFVDQAAWRLALKLAFAGGVVALAARSADVTFEAFRRLRGSGQGAS